MNIPLITLFSEKDNQSLDPVSVWGSLFSLVGVGLEVWMVVIQRSPFDLMAYAGGVGVLISTIAGGKALRSISKSESGT